MAAACPMARRLYEKGQTIFRQGEPAREMGVVLSGAVHIESVDLWGHRTLLSRVGPGQVFGETYALTGGPLLVDAVAAEDCEILAIRLGALLGENHAGASWQGKLLRNLVSHFRREEPGPLPPHFLHQPQDHPGQACHVPFRPGPGAGQQLLFHSL